MNKINSFLRQYGVVPCSPKTGRPAFAAASDDALLVHLRGELAAVIAGRTTGLLEDVFDAAVRLHARMPSGVGDDLGPKAEYAGVLGSLTAYRPALKARYDAFTATRR